VTGGGRTNCSQRLQLLAHSVLKAAIGSSDGHGGPRGAEGLDEEGSWVRVGPCLAWQSGPNIRSKLAVAIAGGRLVLMSMLQALRVIRP
jgi:hypothetical protein